MGSYSSFRSDTEHILAASFGNNNKKAQIIYAETMPFFSLHSIEHTD